MAGFRNIFGRFASVILGLGNVVVAQPVPKTVILQKAAQAARAIPDDPGTPSLRPNYLDPFVGGERRFAVLSLIAIAKAKSGDVNGALELESSMQDESQKAMILREIAAGQARQGNVPGALRTADQIHIDRDRVSALAHIAVSQANSGDRAGAESTFKKALDAAAAKEGTTLERGTLLVLRITRIQQAAGKTSNVKQALGVLDSTNREGKPLFLEVAKLELVSGHARDALQTITRFGSDPGTLSEFAIAQAQVGDVGGALATINRINGDFPKMAGLAGIAKVQANAGDTKGAAETAANLKGPEPDLSTWRASAMAEVGKAAALKGDRATATKSFQQAIRMIEMSPDTSGPQSSGTAYFKATELAKIAQLQADARDKAGSSETFLKAVQIVATMPKPLPDLAYEAFSKSMARHVIAKAQAQAGDLQGALHTANEIEVIPGKTDRGWPGGNPRIATLYEIAASEGRRGASTAEVAWIVKLTSRIEQAWAWLGLVQGMLSRATAD